MALWDSFKSLNGSVIDASNIRDFTSHQPECHKVRRSSYTQTRGYVSYDLHHLMTSKFVNKQNWSIFPEVVSESMQANENATKSQLQKQQVEKAISSDLDSLPIILQKKYALLRDLDKSLQGDFFHDFQVRKPWLAATRVQKLVFEIADSGIMAILRKCRSDIQRQNEQRCEHEIEDIRRGVRSGNITPDSSAIRFSDEALDEQKHSIRVADEKVALAVQAYDLRDKDCISKTVLSVSCFFTVFFLLGVVNDLRDVFIAYEIAIQTWFIYIILILFNTSFGLTYWKLGKELYLRVDTHIQQLDQYLKKFDEELRRERENAAITGVPASGHEGNTKSGRGHESGTGRGGRKKSALEFGFINSTLLDSRSLLLSSSLNYALMTSFWDTSKTRHTTLVTAAATEAQTSTKPTGMDLDLPVDPNEPTYCFCNQVSFGAMVACDNPNNNQKENGTVQTARQQKIGVEANEAE
ncbi:unnamed protein product [Sphenostylis stenocarpa]|uniref:Inhibitor of growth protein N-terminal histone-binding domain-containing protein n=1 Tax=Sphenostylis stenocarpa TaxID=92480 RepID=A0AA86SNK2_9FABA|nr:unnamed protein product [Sphenostylis stenocarpa]